MLKTKDLWIMLLGAVALTSCGGELLDEAAEDGSDRGTFGAFTATQVALYAKKAGIPCGQRLRVAVAVAYAESGYNPRAYNRNTNGTVDKGLWQINTYYHPPRCNYYDPACNASTMVKISSHGTNWRPWYGYGTHNYWTAYNSHAKRGAEAACHGGGGGGAATPSAPSTPATSSSFLFDADFYLYLYSDLRRAFGKDRAAARRHWETYGIKEGRTASPGFSVRYYLSKYGDLRRAFGTNYRAAINHWLKYGKKEGRRTSRAFDVKYYLSHHGDLTRAFGAKNYAAAVKHWLKYGIKEGRSTAKDFSVRSYLKRYGDLRRAFGTNYRSAFWHWFRYGSKEHRNPGP